MSVLFQLRFYIRSIALGTFALFSAQAAWCAFDPTYQLVNSEISYASSQLKGQRVFAITDRSNRMSGAVNADGTVAWIEVSDKYGQTTFDFESAHSLISVRKAVAGGIQIFTFAANVKKSRFDLVRLAFEPDTSYFNDDDLTGITVDTKSVNDNSRILQDANCQDKASTNQKEITSKASLDEILSRKLIVGCGDRTAMIARELAKFDGERAECVAEYFSSKYQNSARKVLLAIKQPKSGLNLKCTSSGKSMSDGKSFAIRLGKDAFEGKDQERAVARTVTHELLHSAGIKSEDDVKKIVEGCVGPEQSSFGSPSSKADTSAAQSTSQADPLNIASPTLMLGNVSGIPGIEAAIPQTMKVAVESADQVQAMKPALAKFENTSTVFRRQVSKALERMPTLIPSAYAGTGQSFGARANVSGESYVAEPISFNADGPILQLPTGELAQVTVPFKKSSGFGQGKATAIERSTFSSIGAQPLQNAVGAESGSVASQISESFKATRGYIDRAPKPISLESNEAGTSNLTSTDVRNGGGGVHRGTSSVATFNKNRGGSNGATTGNYAEAQTSAKTFSFRSWDDAWSRLKKSENPTEILTSEAFKNFGKKVSFKGQIYGPSNAKRIINLDSYWNPER